MTTLIESIQPYAKLVGVMAAVVIFGSWIVENIVARRFKEARDAILRAQDDKETTERFFHVESKLLEVYQVAASARKYSAEAPAQNRWTFKDTVYSDIERLEQLDVTRQFAYSFAAYSGRTQEFINAINPPLEIATRVRDATSTIIDLLTQLDKRRDEYMNGQRRSVGDPINLDTITKEQAEQLSSIISRYSEDVWFGLSPKLTPAANEMFRSYDALFAYAHEELARRERRATLVTRIQVVLFILGSIVALFSAYLEATAAKPPTPCN